ncbi:MAG: DegT/DnrJ/EryC1/StrS family aminotransferase [Rhizobiaceae bacterium]
MQKDFPFARPLIDEGEKQAVMEVLSGNVLTHGPKCREFEEQFADYVGVKHAITTSNCTTALHLSLVANGVGEGDEVIVPAMTHVATAHAVEHSGATPMFADIDPLTGNIDSGEIERLCTPKTKAIIVVHYLGLPCDMDAILSIAESRDIVVIEDSATAVGAKFGDKHAGSIGKTGCFSFYPSKHMTTMEGGMLTTNDDLVAAKVKNIRAFGYDKGLGERSVPGVYDIISLGWNYRMSEGHAAVGVVQLSRLPEFLAARQVNAECMISRLQENKDITVFPLKNGDARSSWYCVNVTLPEGRSEIRRELISKLNGVGVGTSVHYPVALPLSKYYSEKYGYKVGSHPVAEWVANHTISLPCGPHLTETDADDIALLFLQIYNDF